MRIAVIVILAFFSTISYSQSSSDKNAEPDSEAGSNYRFEPIASDLNFPWSIAFLPGGDYLVSLRVGEIRRVSKTGVVGPALANTPTSYVAGQGGYFDIVLDPDFATNNTIYLSFAYGTDSSNGTRIVKATLADDRLDNLEAIYTVSPLKDTAVHYGGRMLFLADKTLLMTTGDGFEYREAAQDKFSQLGKIIRINRDGSVPADNPYADGKTAHPMIYSLGHRSPQGLDIDPLSNTIYMHEHGPKGGDEVNVVKSGTNYGWPVASFGVNYSGAQVTPFQTVKGMQAPIKVWTPSIAPSGLAFCACEEYPDWRNSLFVGALVDQEVSRLSVKDQQVIGEQRLFSELNARIRDIRVGPDGYLYILTDSEQGELIRVMPN